MMRLEAALGELEEVRAGLEFDIRRRRRSV